MDKYDWENQCDLLKNFLKQKKVQKTVVEREIEELTYTIECYKKKIDSLPTPKRKRPEKFDPKKVPTGVR